MSSKEQYDSVDNFFTEHQKPKISKKLVGKILGINDKETKQKTSKRNDGQISLIIEIPDKSARRIIGKRKRANKEFLFLVL